jgi:hypothetical protein
MATVNQAKLRARRHGASFAPKKYTLVHFTKARTKHNHSCPFTLPTSAIHPSPSAHDLGVILNKKLSWQLLLQHIKSKLATQTNVFSMLTASTWGASIQVLRLLYTAVVRPAIPTSCPAWWAPPFYAILLKRGGGRAPESQKLLFKNRLWGLQDHNSTKPTGRSGRPPLVPPHGWQAGTILLEVCRVRDRQGD